MKSPINIAVPPGYRVLRIERHPERHTCVIDHADGDPTNNVFSNIIPIDTKHPGFYKLWIHTNDFILGTYIALYDTGKIIRVTVRDDEPDDEVLIKPEDN